MSIVDRILASYCRHVSPDNPADLDLGEPQQKYLLNLNFGGQVCHGSHSLLTTGQYRSYRYRLLHSIMRPINLMRISLPDFHHFRGWSLGCTSSCKEQTARQSLLISTVGAGTQASETVLFKLHQQHFMSKVLAALITKMAVSVSSPLHSLNPILDSHGVLRVGGRLSQSGLLYSQCHPVILHK